MRAVDWIKSSIATGSGVALSFFTMQYPIVFVIVMFVFGIGGITYVGAEFYAYQRRAKEGLPSRPNPPPPPPRVKRKGW